MFLYFSVNVLGDPPTQKPTCSIPYPTISPSSTSLSFLFFITRETVVNQRVICREAPSHL